MTVYCRLLEARESGQQIVAQDLQVHAMWVDVL